MTSRRRHNLVLSIYPQTRGFAFTLFEGWLAPVDWGFRNARGRCKNEFCLKRIEMLLTHHAPNVVILQDTSEQGTHRVARIRQLNLLIAELAESYGLVTHAFSRQQVRDCFQQHSATSKQMIAETIAKHIPALQLYVPPPRKAWTTEHTHMGIFDAAALAWTFFHATGAASRRELSSERTMV